MVAWFQKFPGQVWTWLCEAINEIAVWGSNMISQGKQAASSFVSNVISTITSLPSKVAAYAGQMATAAYNMVYGMVSGITNAGGAVWSAITRICSNSLSAIKSFFGIASPSKVMREMFGYVGEGMALGLEDKSDRVVGAMKSVANGAMDAASMTVTPSAASGSDLASALRIALEDVNITAQTYLDGRNVSDAIAEYLDSVNGGRQRLANRGLAL